MNSYRYLMRPKAILTVVCSSVALMLVAACDGNKVDTSVMASPRTSVGTEIDDSVVTTKVKSALLSDPEIKSLDIKVETRKGEVMLSGFVSNQAQAERAIQVARGTAGVKLVSNKMDLKDGAASVGNTVDDGVITAKVRAALLGDPSINSTDIAVVTRKGATQLSGFVNDQTQISRAIDLTRMVDGVKSVTNEMSVKK